MGLFGRARRPSTSRIAEGGPATTDGSALAPGSSGGKAATKYAQATTKKSAAATTGESLELFGADSDDSDDDATIERYANGAAPDRDEVDEQEALAAESKKVSTLLSKVAAMPMELCQCR